MGTGGTSLYRRFGKRALDLALALPALVLLSPVLAAVALSVRWTSGPPILFRQPRPGRDGRLFTLLKFRTMRPQPEGRELADAERLTRLGRFLRRSSLDELPELVHVLSGRMSLVGPRPLLPEYLPLYSPRQARRHEVRPGLTGLAQIGGRNAISWEDRLELDVRYVDDLSLALDLRILLATIWAVIRGKGIHAAGHATMPPFRGAASDSGVEGSRRC